MKSKLFETIAGPAVKRDGVIYKLDAPADHRDVLRHMAACGHPVPVGGIQGFMTSTGRFVVRREARLLALMAAQLLPTAKRREELYCEDVW